MWDVGHPLGRSDNLIVLGTYLELLGTDGRESDHGSDGENVELHVWVAVALLVVADEICEKSYLLSDPLRSAPIAVLPCWVASCSQLPGPNTSRDRWAGATRRTCDWA